MKSVNNKVVVTVNEDGSASFKTQYDERILKVNTFKGKVSFYMHGQKGFLVLEGIPKLRRDKNVLILDVGSGFYNVEFICFTVEEMTARIEELKKIITNLFNKYTEIKKELENKKPFTKKFDRKKPNFEQFNSISVPQEFIDLADKFNKEKYNKTPEEYVNDLIFLFESNNIAKIDENKVKLSKEFVETVYGLKYTFFK